MKSPLGDIEKNQFLESQRFPNNNYFDPSLDPLLP